MGMPYIPPYEDRPECPTCALKMRYMPPGYWSCLFHGAAWLQKLKAWWRGTPLMPDRALGFRLCAERFDRSAP